MAAEIPVFSIHDAMIACGVPDNGNFQGNTDAERVAMELFDNDFRTVMDKSIKDLDNDFTTLSALTALQGQIRVRPRAQRNIKAFVQWTRDQYRMGRNPSHHAFPSAEAPMYTKRLKQHDDFVKQSKTMCENTAPQQFTKDMKWYDWNLTFRNHLRAYVGRDGVPLSYVIRDNAIQDPTPQADFLDEYINMAPLQGEAYAADNKQVLTLLMKYIVGHNEAESAIQALNTTTDGRAAYLALKIFYEGEGLLATDIMEAKRTLTELFYNGEKKPYMWWTKFEQMLNKAYAAYNKAEGREVYSDGMKLRDLQGKIRADFLQSVKDSIDTAIATSIGLPNQQMNYTTAMRLYRMRVQQKFPAGAQSTPVGRGRHVRELKTNGGGYGRGGKGGRGNYRNNRRHDPNRRDHPDAIDITLRNGKKIKYHASYRFTDDQMRQFTDEQRDRLRREREEYKARKNPARAEIAELRSAINTMSSNMSQIIQQQGGSVPEEVDGNPAASTADISQITTGTAGRSIIGGRNQQSHQRQNGGRR